MKVSTRLYKIMIISIDLGFRNNSGHANKPFDYSTSQVSTGQGKVPGSGNMEKYLICILGPGSLPPTISLRSLGQGYTRFEIPDRRVFLQDKPTFVQETALCQPSRQICELINFIILGTRKPRKCKCWEWFESHMDISNICYVENRGLVS